MTEYGQQETLGRDKKPRRVSELASKDPLLEWFIRWLGAKPDSQRNLLKSLASCVIDPGVSVRLPRISLSFLYPDPIAYYYLS